MLLLFVLVGTSGCASFSEPRQVKRKFEIEAPKDLVWEGMIYYFSSNRIPISKLEEDRGVIYAERLYRSSIKDHEYAECPSGHILREARTIMNIMVTERKFVTEPHSDSTYITINLQFQRAYTSSTIQGEVLGTEFYDCESTGIAEREIYKNVLEYVAQRKFLPGTASVSTEELENQ